MAKTRRILLVGGGSGGHMTPLVAIAESLQQRNANLEIVAVCEKGSRFHSILARPDSISKLKTIHSGKLRRYPNRTWLQRLTDIKTFYFNIRDFFLTLIGLLESVIFLVLHRPNLVFVKGGFVGVPIGLAAAVLRVPIITHDSDFLPGLANKILSRWAILHLNGMPVEQTRGNTTTYVGIPLTAVYAKVTKKKKAEYRDDLFIAQNSRVLTVVGGSLGGEQLNNDIVDIAHSLFSKFPDLHILHIAGQKHETDVMAMYKSSVSSQSVKHVTVIGFTTEAYKYTGAADVVVSRASATTISELAVQAKSTILVPGRLSGDHQRYNALYFSERDAAKMVEWGNKDLLLETILKLLQSEDVRKSLEEKISKYAVPNSAEKIADILIERLDCRLSKDNNKETDK